MKTYLMTSAVAAVLVASPAFAMDSMETKFHTTPKANDIHASEFIGMRVYASEKVGAQSETVGVQDGWEDVGEINDLLITREGNIDAVLVDIGGFLGIGERQVAMSMDSIRFLSDTETEEPNDYFLVIPASRANLEEAPEYEVETASTGWMGTMTPREGYETAEVEQLTTEDLTGAAVYDSRDEWIGEIDQLNVTDAGKIEAAIIDVGGFLGLGEKPVALEVSQLQFMRAEAGGDDVRVYVDMSKQELEALPTAND